MDSATEAPERVCIICLDSDPPPIQSGCACRSDTGLAHLGCLIEKAVTQQAHRGYKVWWECQTCKACTAHTREIHRGSVHCSDPPSLNILEGIF